MKRLVLRIVPSVAMVLKKRWKDAPPWLRGKTRAMRRRAPHEKKYQSKKLTVRHSTFYPPCFRERNKVCLWNAGLDRKRSRFRWTWIHWEWIGVLFGLYVKVKFRLRSAMVKNCNEWKTTAANTVQTLVLPRQGKYRQGFESAKPWAEQLTLNVGFGH